MYDDNEVRAAVAKILKDDEQLVEMLGKNPPWSNLKAARAKKHSIVPADKFPYEGVDMPIITLMMSGVTRVGYNLTETVLYVRCYNNSQKTYVDITTALARVATLLHRKPLQLSDSRFIQFEWDFTGQEMVDEGYKLPFREARFTLQRV